MNTWRTKPGVVEAIRWSGPVANQSPLGNIEEITAFLGYRPTPGYTSPGGNYLIIDSSEGMEAIAWPGFWIIRDTEGNVYPCHPGVFDLTYETDATAKLTDAQDMMSWAREVLGRVETPI